MNLFYCLLRMIPVGQECPSCEPVRLFQADQDQTQAVLGSQESQHQNIWIQAWGSQLDCSVWGRELCFE